MREESNLSTSRMSRASRATVCGAGGRFITLLAFHDTGRQENEQLLFRYGLGFLLEKPSQNRHAREIRDTRHAVVWVSIKTPPITMVSPSRIMTWVLASRRSMLGPAGLLRAPTAFLVARTFIMICLPISLGSREVI